MFESSPQLVDWIHWTFLDEDSPLYDSGHDHLNSANIGALWTNVPMVSKMVPVIGTAQIPRPPQGVNRWERAKWEMQQRQLFGPEALDLNFVITLYAPYSIQASDLEFCSDVKHELCHCAQDEDEFGPKFRKKDNRPVFAIRDHDFAGFLSNVRDFGAGAERNVPELIETVKLGPRIAAADITRMCGTCLRAA